MAIEIVHLISVLTLVLTQIQSPTIKMTASSSLINKAELIKEQRDDETLRGCWKLAERGRGNFLIDDV